jgi:hypothetical protein
MKISPSAPPSWGAWVMAREPGQAGRWGVSHFTQARRPPGLGWTQIETESAPAPTFGAARLRAEQGLWG